MNFYKKSSGKNPEDFFSPYLTLADEPTGNLDEDTAVEIMALFREAAKEYNKCVIIVSHSNEVAKQADVVFVLKQGKLLFTELF